MKTNHNQLRTALFAIVRTRLFVMWVAVCLASNLCFAITYDVAADFSATNNPNGVWSYGWSSTLTSALNLYTDKYKPYDFGGIDVWSELGITYPPAVAHNGTGSVITLYGHNLTWQIGQLSLGPGNSGEHSHARWTAPNAGIFDIAATFTGIDADGVTTDVHVLHNGNWILNDSTALSATIVPEPATILLFGLGGLAAMRRRRAGRN
jgi:hypothetical protein